MKQKQPCFHDEVNKKVLFTFFFFLLNTNNSTIINFAMPSALEAIYNQPLNWNLSMHIDDPSGVF